MKKSELKKIVAAPKADFGKDMKAFKQEVYNAFNKVMNRHSLEDYFEPGDKAYDAIEDLEKELKVAYGKKNIAA